MRNKIKLENKKTKGEVFTPPLLAEEMIALLPDIKIDDTILDPCSGATNVFPIMYMFRYVKKFGKEYISKYINNCLYMAEINELAVEYGEMILMRYVKMLENKDVDIVRQHYIDNYSSIIDEYYDYCELSNDGI